MLLKIDQQFSIDMAKLGIEDKKLVYKVWDLVLDTKKHLLRALANPKH